MRLATQQVEEDFAMKTFLAATLIASISGLSSAAGAEEAPTRAQVEELQKQLAEMQKEMDALRSALAEAEAKGGASYPMMHKHMQGMHDHWQRMHNQTCMMAPGTCPHMGAPAPR